MRKIHVSISQIREMADLGYTKQEVADELRVTTSLIRKRSKEHSIRFHRGRVDPYIRAEIIRLVGEGVNKTIELCTILGRTRAMVCRWIRELVECGELTRVGKSYHTRLKLARHGGVSKPVLESICCEGCMEIFAPKRKGAKFCSRSCNLAANRGPGFTKERYA